MFIGGEAANIDGLKRPLAFSEGLPCEAQAERPREHLRENGEHRGTPGHAKLLEQAFGWDEREAAAFSIDLGYGIAREGHEHRCAAALGPHFEQIAGAEILNRHDLPELRAVLA